MTRRDRGAALAAIEELLAIMDRLREPGGCPWDRAQTFDSVAPHTFEEACEVVDAIERGDMEDLQDELGDLLFQVVFHARMAAEQGRFDFAAVAQGLCAKLVRRHPHVFGTEPVGDFADQARVWEAIKAAERARRPRDLAWGEDVPRTLPALSRAAKLQRRASRLGLDWPDAESVLPKIAEELEEVRQAMAAGDREALAMELGDLLFSCVNLARRLDLDPEQALRRSNRKFMARVQAVMAALDAEGAAGEEPDPERLDRLWQQVKRRTGGG